MEKYLFLSHIDMLKHGSVKHPECAERLNAILEAFSESPYQRYLDLSIRRLATINELTQVHDIDYINYILSLDGKEVYLDQETILSKDSVQAALLATGLGLELVEKVVAGTIQNGFALVRPPGHHARTSLAMGFCFFNQIAVAAKKALSMGIKRILILDFDVHHGNGTQETFYSDDNVLFIDLHQENLFPVFSGLLSERGKGKGLGFTVNIPLPAFCSDQDYLYAFDQFIKPLTTHYSPELILVSAGFDAHESDPMGMMNLTTRGYGLLTKKIKSLAEQLCRGKVVFFLEGGYNPFFLAKNVMECVRELVDENYSLEIAEEDLKPSKAVEKLIKEMNESYFKSKK